MKPGLRDFLWMAVGAVLLLALTLVVLHFQNPQNPSTQLALNLKRVEAVEHMRLALASASEAEKSAVLAITDEDSQTYADQARAATAKVEQGRQELSKLLNTGASKSETDALAQFSQGFAEFKRIDQDLLGLAVLNTNLKANSLAFGPAAAVLQEMDAALAAVIASHADDVKVVQLADAARIAAWRLLALLPPHIAEESDQKMDVMEAAMANEDQAVRQNLEALAALPSLAGNAELATATARYGAFTELKAQILKLSRQNTNVRSLAISLNQKRKVMLVCQDALAALEQAIHAEPVAAPMNPR